MELHDLLIVERSNETQLTISGLEVAQDGNSVLAAHEAIEEAARRKLAARFHLHKRIPPGSGMGGASSDAAAALKALQAMFMVQDVNLREVAAQLGSDVPFFLVGGRAKAEGRGERLTSLPVPKSTWFALAWPGVELKTVDVYRAWDDVKGERPNQLRRAAEKVEPRVREFAQGLGDGWQMTGSGSAFFKQVDTEEEARRAVERLACWTAVTRAID